MRLGDGNTTQNIFVPFVSLYLKTTQLQLRINGTHFHCSIKSDILVFTPFICIILWSFSDVEDFCVDILLTVTCSMTPLHTWSETLEPSRGHSGGDENPPPSVGVILMTTVDPFMMTTAKKRDGGPPSREIRAPYYQTNWHKRQGRRRSQWCWDAKDQIAILL